LQAILLQNVVSAAVKLRFENDRPRLLMPNELPDYFARTLAELSAILIQSAKAPVTADSSRAELEAYLHEMRKAEGQLRPTTASRARGYRTA